MTFKSFERTSCLKLSVLAILFIISACKTRSFDQSKLDSDKTKIQWEPCSIPNIPSLDLPEGVSIDCVTFKVPLDWSNPNEEKIDFLLRRVRSSKMQSIKTQVWYSEGGPGIPAGASALKFANEVAADPTLEIFVPDQRGVGSSTKLGCGLPVDLIPSNRLPPGEFKKCIEVIERRWGANLKNFSTNAAAQDAIEISKKMRSEGARFFFQGQSYGSYLTNEIALLAPDLPSGWIFTGYAPGGWIAHQGNQDSRLAIEAVIKRLCTGSEVCETKLGKKPEQVLYDGLTSIKAGRCRLQDRFSELKSFLSDFSQSDGPAIALFPVIAHRLKRCNDRDIAFVKALLSISASPANTKQETGIIDLSRIDLKTIPEQSKIQGGLLASLIFASEIYWPRPWPKHEAIVRELAREPFFEGDLDQMEELRSFPTYVAKFQNGIYATTSRPVLILAGERDREAPADLARNAASTYKLNTQQVIVLPWATHGVLRSGPKTADGRFCSVVLRNAFLANPEVPVDQSCANNTATLIPPLPPLDARLPPEFGLADSVWGD